MSDYLFVYGTLQTGHAPDEIAHAVETLQHVGSAFVRGVLYDLGEYPGAVLDPSSKQKISGMVLQLPEDANVLRQLDEYEGFDPNAPDESLFVRVLQEVVMESGRTLRCWVYVYNRDPGSSPVLTHGKYPKKHSGSGIDKDTQ